jgi:hypothetical protein
MSKFCSNCGKPLIEGRPFCAECGAKTEAPPENVQEQPQAEPVQEQPAEPEPPPVVAVQPPPQQPAPIQTAKPVGAFTYLGWIFLMGLPGVGLVLSILFGFKKEPSNKRSLARAMIFYSIVSIIVCVVMGILLFIFTQVVDDLQFKILGFTITF